MSMQSHIAAVSQKRAEIKSRINAEMAHASPDFALITKLKKQNLRLKEEMLHYFQLLKSAAAS